MARAVLRRTARAVGLLVLLLLAALLAGAVLPRNAGWREAATGIVIGVDATAVHTELILPITAAGHDWRAVLPPGSVPPGTTHLSFSWGERNFFLATPNWADVSVRRALGALFFSRESLVHLYRLGGPAGYPLTLSEAEYRRLATFIAAEIGQGPPLSGYGPADIFLVGTSRYSWKRTCNDWAADALAAAGVRVGLWTPIPQSLMWRFETTAGQVPGAGEKR